MANTRDQNPEKIEFKWLSFKIAYSVLLTSGVGLSLTLLFKDGPLIFITPLSSCFILLSLWISIGLSRKKWKKFVLRMYEIELDIFAKYGPPTDLKKSIKFMMIAFVSSHFIINVTVILSYIYKIGGRAYGEQLISKCSKSTGTNCNLFWAIVETAYWFIVWYGWSVCDMFLILLSTIFSNRFNLVSRYFEAVVQKISVKVTYGSTEKEQFLELSKQICTDYNKLVDVFQELDKIATKSIWCSYCSNIYFILGQLFIFLRQRDSSSFWRFMYFSYSLAVGVIRMSALTISAGSINEESKRFIQILHAVPNGIWNTSLRRLMSRIQFDSAAFTGGHLFVITKSLLLHVAGTIMAYELILIQFTKYSMESEVWPDRVILKP